MAAPWANVPLLLVFFVSLELDRVPFQVSPESPLSKSRSRWVGTACMIGMAGPWPNVHAAARVLLIVGT